MGKRLSKHTVPYLIFVATVHFILGLSHCGKQCQELSCISRSQAACKRCRCCEADFYEGSDALKEQSTPERSLLSEEIEETLFKVVEKLPDDLRMAITLREIEGLSYEEIANVMSCPVGTVRSRIFRAREAIDKVIQPLLEN